MTSKAIAKGSDMMGNQNEKLIDEKDDGAFNSGATKSNGLTRLLYSEKWMSAQQEKKAEMEKENLITYFDSGFGIQCSEWHHEEKVVDC
jgi:allantoate deiminase